MRPTRVVIDTSALVDAHDQNHPSWGEAFTSMEAVVPLSAPRILASEAGNVVHRKHPDSFGATASERADFLEFMLRGIDLQDSDAASRARCGELTAELRLTFYDTEFLELAMRDEAAVLLTHDDGLLKSAKRKLGPRRALTLDEALRVLDLET